MKHVRFSPFTLLVMSLAGWVVVQTPALATNVNLFDKPVAPQGEKLSPLDVKMRAAFEAMNKKNLVAARAALTDAQKLDPKSIDVQLALAELARQANKPDDIEVALKKALEIDPKSPDALSAWSRWRFAKNDFNGAEDYLRRAIEAKPDYARLHIDMGDLHLGSLQKPKEAVADYTKATELDPKSPGAFAGLGSGLVALGDRKGATKAFERAAVLAPKNPLPQVALGRISKLDERYKDAVKFFDKALALQPGMVGVMTEKADTLVLDGRRNEAIGVYREATKLAPKDAVVPTKLGMALQQEGKTQDAFAAYQQALVLQPKSALALNNMAVLALESKTRTAEAEGWARKAVELEPKVATYLDTLAWVLQTTGKGTDALGLLKDSVTAFPASGQLQYRRGLLLEAAGNPADALKAYQSALKAEPKFESAKDAQVRVGKLGAAK